MHHKCEGKYLVLVTSGGGSVASAMPRSVVAGIRRRRVSSASRAALRQRLAPSAYHSVSVSHESLCSTLFTRLSGAHLCTMDTVNYILLY